MLLGGFLFGCGGIVIYKNNDPIDRYRKICEEIVAPLCDTKRFSVEELSRKKIRRILFQLKFASFEEVLKGAKITKYIYLKDKNKDKQKPFHYFCATVTRYIKYKESKVANG